MDTPIVIRAARAWFGLFRCQSEPLQSMLPPGLEPVTLRAGRGIASIGVFEFTDTDQGPFSQAVISFAVRHRPWFTPPFGSMLLERRAADFGYWIHQFAVSSPDVCRLQAETWGYPGFVADIRVQARRSKVRTIVYEDGVELMQLDMKRPGADMPLHFPWRTYSRLGDEILRAEMSVDAIGRERSVLTSARFTVHRHERMENLRALAIEGANPIEVRWYDSFRGRLDLASARFRSK